MAHAHKTMAPTYPQKLTFKKEEMKDKERKRGAKATILHTGIRSHVFAPKVSYGYRLPPKFQAAAI